MPTTNPTLVQDLSWAQVPRLDLVEFVEGEFFLAEKSRLLIADERLWPLAGVLAREMAGITGRSLSVESGSSPALGDIILAFDENLGDEISMVEIEDRIRITGRDYLSVARGSALCLQALDEHGRAHHCRLRDHPRFAYSGLMLDLARKPHDFRVLLQAVVLCRFYRVKYLHLHFSDDQAFTFPSTAFPELGGPRRYTLAQMRELEKFATDRGVEIIPELDMPGHSTTLLRDLPGLRCDVEGKDILCPGREETYRIMETLLGEMADVFRSAAWLHIGADEFDTTPWQACPCCGHYMEKNGIGNAEELFCHFIVRMDEIVRKLGRRTLIWEGFRPELATLVPKHIPVMIFESLYATAPELLAAGFSVINTSWQPLYVVNQRNWTPEEIHAWNPYRWENWWGKSRAHPHGIDVPPSDRVLGAQLCTWEQPGEIEIASTRRRLAALMDRLCDPEHREMDTDFSQRLEAADARLEKVLATSVT